MVRTFATAAVFFAITMVGACGDTDTSLGNAGGTSAAVAASYATIATCVGDAIGVPFPSVSAAQVAANCNQNDLNIATVVFLCLNNGNICGQAARYNQPGTDKGAIAQQVASLTEKCFEIATRANPPIRASCASLIPSI